MNKKYKALVALALVVASVFGFSKWVSAHNKSYDDKCDKLTLQLTQYASHQNKTNTVKVTIDGSEIVNTNFQSSYGPISWPWDETKDHSWQIKVTAWDDPNGNEGWTFSAGGTQKACKPPVTTTSTTTTTTTTTSTTLPPTTTTAPTTTVAATTTAPSTTAAATTTTLPATTTTEVAVVTTVPPTAPPTVPTVPRPPATPNLPETGAGGWVVLAIIAAVLVIAGLVVRRILPTTNNVQEDNNMGTVPDPATEAPVTNVPEPAVEPEAPLADPAVPDADDKA